MSKYPSFPKIPRIGSDIVVTEKIDGTNGLIRIDSMQDDRYPDVPVLAELPDDELVIRAGSRNRWLTSPSDDNFGFARWVLDHGWELRHLGPGHHYGEWWGHGIQRGYDAPRGERYFSLFDVFKWDGGDAVELAPLDPDATEANLQQNPVPEVDGLFVVPIIGHYYSNPSNEYDFHALTRDARWLLREYGSHARPRQGYDRPEGVVIYHVRARQSFKWPFDK